MNRTMAVICGCYLGHVRHIKKTAAELLIHRLLLLYLLKQAGLNVVVNSKLCINDYIAVIFVLCLTQNTNYMSQPTFG